MLFRSRLDPTLRMCKVAHALDRFPMRAKPPAFHPDVLSVKMRMIFFCLVILQVTRKVTKISWGEFYCSHLH